MTKVRDIHDDDMLEVTEWFAQRKWPIPPGPGILPQTGFVAEKDGKLLAVAWLYLTNSSIAFVEWTATKPNSGIKGLMALKDIMDYIKEKISTTRTRVLLQFVPNKKMVRHMEKKFKFKKSEDATLMMWSRQFEGEV